MEKMLINATQSEEIRVALVKDNHLYDLDIDCPSEVKKKGNIYKAVVTRREPSLDAVFVEYGAKRQGFLPLKEIAPEYLSKDPQNFGDDKPPITALIREGQELLIQVDKEERGNKGAALTTFITLAGCYLVLMPNNPNSGGISRRIEGDERDELRETLNALQLPEGMGLIIRTAGVGKGQDELQADLDMLCNQWQAIRHAYQNQIAPCLIHQEGDVIIRSIRDNLRKSVSEIIIDDQISYVKAKQYIEQVKPDFLPNVKLYNNPVPLFNCYQIESQIETAYQREVLLPSGGSLVIDRTEALVSIDINSAKATGGTDIEATALNTNLEAADEIARQLRLRDLGGLIVIDFIDMGSGKNQRDVENRLKEALKADRARIQIGRISRFGLLEMSRQRLRLSLGEAAQEICPRCEGRGTVRNIQSHSLSIIRLIEEEALKDKTAEVHVQLPVEMATFIMNEKRDFILNIEKRHKVCILIVANPYMQRPQYSITRLKEDNVGKNKKPSYTLIQQPELEMARANTDSVKLDEPAVKTFTPSSTTKTPTAGFIKRLWSSLFGHTEETNKVPTENRVNQQRAKPKHHKTHEKRNQNSKRRRPNNSGHHSNINQQQRHSGGQGGQRKKVNSNQNQQQQNNNNRVIPIKPDLIKKKEAMVNKESEN
ncbi:Rne/Rng family ribonuclease [Legionella gresilensis]|uniref:Rne/Rng family ribonuclease n=1 Tax=Legionella gresilensis TaxID=91823 RepID=UPI0013EF5D3E|nr:Rne/Rng family ribonuclease [Legionella gresilensis]